MIDLRHRTLLLRSDVLPRADGDARRLFQFVEFLRAAGCGVTCVTPLPPGGHASAARLADLGATVVWGDETRVVELVRAEAFDWVLCGGWHAAAPLIAPLRVAAAPTRLVVDVGDVRRRWQARRSLREAEGRRGDDTVRDTTRELEVYAAADAVLAASRADAEIVADLIGDRRHVFVVPDAEDLVAARFPFRRRRGMVMVGDFARRPDVDALAWIGDDVLPHVAPAVLADNPLSVAGTGMTDEIRGFAADWPTVRMLGRVPSLVPYLERARATLVPLPHGAGQRRLTIQSLAIGTPVITTTAGIEGLAVAAERDVLVADDPVQFAAAITRLLTDEPLWNDLARAGRGTIRAEHGRHVASRSLGEALAASRGIAAPAGRPARARRMTQRDYDVAVEGTRRMIECGTPPGAVVAVVSRGDAEAVRLDGRTGWHFPLGDEGDYAGWYPGTGIEAVEHLEAVRSRGAEFLAIPAPSLWWLGHYGDLRAHLESACRVIAADGGLGVLVSLRDPPTGPQSLAGVAAESAAAAPPDDHPAAIPFEGLADRHAVTRPPAGPPPAISVVIATRDRATLLAEALDALAGQSVEAAAFEVVVVDDGSTDGTADVCRAAAGRLRLTLVESPPAGTAAARNLGVAAATAPLVLFLADDAVADAGLVAAHLAAHGRLPLEHVAVVGATSWHPRLPVTELMRFIAGTGDGLGGFPPLPAGPALDRADFRAADASLARSLLVRAGGFRSPLSDGAEDLEAAWRMGRMLAAERSQASGFAAEVGLAVVSCPAAEQHVIRPPTFAEVCDRCERWGRALREVSRIAADPRLDAWLGVAGADARWRQCRAALDANVARVHELERLVESTDPACRGLVRELHELYAWTSDALTTKGIVEAAGDA